MVKSSEKKHFNVPSRNCYPFWDLETEAVETLGDDPLKKLIDQMGGWNVTGNMTPLSLMSITERIAKVTRELFIKPFVDIGVSVDPHNSNKHILQVSCYL